MAGLNGAGGGDGSPRPPAASGDLIERPSTAKGTATPENIDRYLASLVARATGEAPEAIAREVALERGADEAGALQRKSAHRGPDTLSGPTPSDANRKLRRARRRERRTGKVVSELIEKARAAGDPDWKPEAFPALDWRIRWELEAATRDVTGKKARILAAGLPPPQAARLIEDARLIAAEIGVEDPYRTMLWRERVAGAWASWRLSRPVRAKQKTKDDGHTRLGDYALGYVPPDPDDWQPPVKRENPWAGGRVVDGYARQAFCLLMRDIRTGEPLSISKLFYRNGSGVQGVFTYLATPAKPDSRAADGVLGLYTRWQPPASKSKYVGYVKKDAEGNPLLDKHGNPQRYALSEHWYHRDMCGRRTARRADKGNREATNVLRELCPWLFDDDAPAEQLLEDLEQRESSVEGAEGPQAPSPASVEVVQDADDRGG